MNKRVEENLRVKRAIVNAFFTLLKKDNLEHISVSEITQTAEVSRMAYYRNFNSKMEIIDFFFDDVLDELMALLNYDISLWTEEYGKAFFQTMRKHRECILLLNEIGLSGIFLKKFSAANEDFAGDMPSNSIDRYKLYYAAGAAYNGTIEWLKSGCLESVEEMSRHLWEFMNSPDESVDY